jgi:hypothetical protein
MSREAMKLALDMLNEIADDVYCDQKLEGVITSLRQALEEEREPLYWSVSTGWVYADDTSQQPVKLSNKFACKPTEGNWVEPIYTAPPKRELTCVCGAVWEGETMVHPPREREWVGLTEEEIAELHHEIKVRLMGTYKTEDIYRAIEKRLKEKNT